MIFPKSSRFIQIPIEVREWIRKSGLSIALIDPQTREDQIVRSRTSDEKYKINADPITRVRARTTQEDRQEQYGDFDVTGCIFDELSQHVYTAPGWEDLKPWQRYAVINIVTKISRILNAGGQHKDNWVDIAGYANKVLEVED